MTLVNCSTVPSGMLRTSWSRSDWEVSSGAGAGAARAAAGCCAASRRRRSNVATSGLSGAKRWAAMSCSAADPISSYRRHQSASAK